MNVLVLSSESSSNMWKITKERTTSRQHPYASPYSLSDCRSMTPADCLSDISEWVLDDRIKDILSESPEVMLCFIYWS